MLTESEVTYDVIPVNTDATRAPRPSQDGVEHLGARACPTSPSQDDVELAGPVAATPSSCKTPHGPPGSPAPSFNPLTSPLGEPVPANLISNSPRPASAVLVSENNGSPASTVSCASPATSALTNGFNLLVLLTISWLCSFVQQLCSWVTPLCVSPATPACTPACGSPCSAPVLPTAGPVVIGSEASDLSGNAHAVAPRNPTVLSSPPRAVDSQTSTLCVSPAAPVSVREGSKLGGPDSNVGSPASSDPHPPLRLRGGARSPTLPPRTGPAPLVVKDRDGETEYLPVDASEGRKVIVWLNTRTTTSGKDLWEFFTSRLGADFSRLVSKCHLRGVRNHRRGELVCFSAEDRNELWTLLRDIRRSLDKRGWRCVLGRTFATRKGARAARRSTFMDVQHRIQTAKSNRFAPLMPLVEDADSGSESESEMSDSSNASRTDDSVDSGSAAEESDRASNASRTDGSIDGDSVAEESDRASNADSLDLAADEGGDDEQRPAPVAIATWNAQGIATSVVELARAAGKKGIDVVIVTESKLSVRHRIPSVNGYKWFGAPRRGNDKTQGVGFLVKEPISLAAEFVVDDKVPDLCWLKFREGTTWRLGPTGSVLGRPLALAALYLSPSLQRATVRARLDLITPTVNDLREGNTDVIVGGDFNCVFARNSGLQPGDDATHGVCGPYARNVNGLSPHVVYRGRIVARWLREVGLISAHGFRAGYREYSHIRMSGKPGNLLDYLVVSRERRVSIKEFVIEKGLRDTLPSDHLLVHVSIDLAVAAPSVLDESANGATRAHRRHCRKLIESRSDLLNADLQDRLMDFDHEAAGTGAEALLALQAIVVDAADANVLATKPRKRSLPQYWDKELDRLISRRRAAYHRFIRAVECHAPAEVVEARSLAYRTLKREVVKAVWQKKRECWNRSVETLARDYSDNLREFWNGLRRLGLAKKSGPKAIVGADGQLAVLMPTIAGVFKSHFERLGEVSDATRVALNALPEVDDQFLADDQVGAAAQPLNAPLAKEEVAKALKALRAGKSAGPDDVSPELLRAVADSLAQPLTDVFNRVWNDEKVPEEWFMATVVPIFKKGDPTSCGNYRGISLMNLLPKVFGKILMWRLKGFLESRGKLRAEQAGFRPGRETLNQLFVLTETMRAYQSRKKGLLLAFIDIRKAYDTVPRSALWRKLGEKGVRGKMLRMLMELYRRVEGQVRVGAAVSESFEVELGVKQGDVLSPLLFNVFIDDILDGDLPTVKVVGQRRLSGLLFADDLVLMAESAAEMQRSLDAVSAWARKWGMSYGISKCGVMRLRSSKGAPLLSAANDADEFVLLNQPLPIVREYTYLGCVVSDTLSWQAEVDARWRKTRAALSSVRHILGMSALSVKARLQVFRACVYQVATYGCGIWGSCSEGQVTDLNVSIRQGVRMCFGCPRVTSSNAVTHLESRLLPVELQSVAERVRLLGKWEGLPVSRWERTSLVGGPSVRGGWNWLYRTKWAVRRLTGLSYTPNGDGTGVFIDVNGVSLRPKEMRRWIVRRVWSACWDRVADDDRPAASWYRTVARCPVSSKLPLYVKHGKDSYGVRNMFLLRAYAFPTVSRLHRWGADGFGRFGEQCPFCREETAETHAHVAGGCPLTKPWLDEFFEFCRASLPDGRVIDRLLNADRHGDTGSDSGSDGEAEDAGELQGKVARLFLGTERWVSPRWGPLIPERAVEALGAMCRLRYTVLSGLLPSTEGAGAAGEGNVHGGEAARHANADAANVAAGLAPPGG